MGSKAGRDWEAAMNAACAGSPEAKELLDLRREEFEAEIAAYGARANDEMARESRETQVRLDLIRAEEARRLELVRKEASEKLEGERVRAKTAMQRAQREFDLRGDEAKERFVADVERLIGQSAALSAAARELCAQAVSKARGGGDSVK